MPADYSGEEHLGIIRTLVSSHKVKRKTGPSGLPRHQVFPPRSLAIVAVALSSGIVANVLRQSGYRRFRKDAA